MMRISSIILVAVLLLGAEARREKFGKLSSSRFLRQVNQADYRPVQSGQPQPAYYDQFKQAVDAAPQVVREQPQAPAFRARPQVSRQVYTAQNQQQQLFNQVLQNRPANSVLLAARQIPTNPSQEVITFGSLRDALPANSTRIVPNLDESFTCRDKDYGYYADVGNNCQIFHVCMNQADVFEFDPTFDRASAVTYQYSFMCGEGTRFDQASLTCGWPLSVVECSSAPTLYSRNMEFFKTTTAAPPVNPAFG